VTGSKKHEAFLMLHPGALRPEVQFGQVRRDFAVPSPDCDSPVSSAASPPQVVSLSQSFRLVTPLLPTELNDFEDYVAGLVLLMQHLGIDRVHVHGVGLGAMVAMHFCFRHPQRTITLQLSHTMLPSKELAEEARKMLRKFSKGSVESVPIWSQRLLLGFGTKARDIDQDVGALRVTSCSPRPRSLSLSLSLRLRALDTQAISTLTSASSGAT
jgi:pimeloyl-ACP methyl ester carboxylesterase